MVTSVEVSASERISAKIVSSACECSDILHINIPVCKDDHFLPIAGRWSS